jgi:hypothetical protein
LNVTNVVSIVAAELWVRTTVAVTGPHNVDDVDKPKEMPVGGAALARDIGDSDSETKPTARAMTARRMLLLTTIT